MIQLHFCELPMLELLVGFPFPIYHPFAMLELSDINPFVFFFVEDPPSLVLFQLLLHGQSL